MLPVPILSYSSLKLYKNCPASYYEIYVNPDRHHRPPLKEDTTGAAPGIVIDKIFDRALNRNPNDKSLVTHFDPIRYNDEKLFYAIAKSNLELTTVHIGAQQQEEWAKSEIAALAFFRQIRQTLLETLQAHDIIQPYMRAQWRFGTYKNPCFINDQLLIAGALDLFTSKDRYTPGRLLDLKASHTTYFLDRDQLKLYQLGVEAHDHKVGMTGFLLYKHKKAPDYYRFPQQEINEATEKFVGISKKIQREEFEYTPSKSSCKLCPLNNNCPKAVKTSQRALDTAGTSTEPSPIQQWESPDL